MHNTHQSQTSNNTNGRDAAIRILGTSVNVVVNEIFTQALEARILYGKAIIRTGIGGEDDSDLMAVEALGIACDLGMEAYKSARGMPTLFQDVELKHEWEVGYYMQADFEEACADNNEF